MFENLLVGAVYGRHKTEREAAQSCGEILERLGLIRRANALAGSLTLLERKRLEMARALATAPRLLLLDEIAGGLTEAECLELVVTIREIRQSGSRSCGSSMSCTLYSPSSTVWWCSISGARSPRAIRAR